MSIYYTDYMTRRSGVICFIVWLWQIQHSFVMHKLSNTWPTHKAAVTLFIYDINVINVKVTDQTVVLYYET